MESTKRDVTISLNSIGFITWLVFLVLKLCNTTNPKFEWLTWFWVWFPLWAPVALDIVLLLVVLFIAWAFGDDI